MIPEAAIQAVSEQLMTDYESQYTLAPDATWRDFEAQARRLLEAARPHWKQAVTNDSLRLDAAEDVCAWLGWFSGPGGLPEGQRYKVLEQLWKKWANTPGSRHEVAKNPHLRDAHLMANLVDEEEGQRPSEPGEERA